MEQNVLQEFTSSEFGTIRALFYKGEPWFVGKDVAKILGYPNTRDAIYKHVFEEDKELITCDTGSGNQKIVIITEPGLYSLIFNRDSEATRKLKYWLSSTVIPHLRSQDIEKEEVTEVELQPRDNPVQLFENQEFGNIRIVEVDDKPYFVASDVVKALGYENVSKTISVHCRWVSKRYIPHPQNPAKQIEVNIIPEGDMYRLIARSKLKSAEKFETWIFDEVLPTIRKTGGYINNGDLFVNTYFSSLPQTEKQLVRGLVSNIEAQQKTITEQQTLISAQENKLTELKPKEEFYDTVAAAEDCITINRMAGILFDKEKIRISQKKLFDFLEKQRFICTDENVYHKPTQTMLNRGYMTYREHSRRTYDHRNRYYKREITFTPLITGKGQIFLTNKIKELYQP